MSEPREISEPGELVYAATPSWWPLIFAFSAALAVCGIFAGGFMVPSYVWSIFGGVVALCALRGLIRAARRDYYRLPRRQRVRGAALPVERIQPPRG